MTPARRLAAAAMVLTLAVGNRAVCTGWQAAPEARMACCKSGATCPMRKSEPQGPGSKHTITQVQADACCAATSNRTTSPAADPAFVLSNAATIPAVAAPVASVSARALHEWRAFVPLPVSPVPRHLLLSVWLV